MLNLLPSCCYIVAKTMRDVQEARDNVLCNCIVYEDRNTIHIWNNVKGKWVKSVYVAFDYNPDLDLETTGLDAYIAFYKYCGKNEVEKMKAVYNPIEQWESCEQMHYSNYKYSNQPIHKTIYEFDANSAFTYGTMQLPDDFFILKEYMQLLYRKKKEALTRLQRNKYKNLQNYLIGYFARVKGLIAVRSNIIRYSNDNIKKRMLEIHNSGGIVYLSNTDSIVTEEKGATVMAKYVNDEIGMFKINMVTDKLFYRSSNAYQLGEKLVYSGVKYFEKKHTDLFTGTVARQRGSLIEGYDFILESDTSEFSRICRVRAGYIEVIVYNSLREVVDVIKYKIIIGG